MARMAIGAIADSAIRVGLADGMTTEATTLRGCTAFQFGQGMRGTFDCTRLKLFGERDLLRREILVTRHRCPGCRRMTAAQELFIDCFMAGAAIRRCDPRIDDKTIVIRAALAHGHLMAIQAGDAFLRVRAQFKFVDDGILQVPMALGALAARTNEGCARLIHFRPRTARVHEKSRDHQASGQSDCDKDSAKSHRGLMMPMLALV